MITITFAAATPSALDVLIADYLGAAAVPSIPATKQTKPAKVSSEPAAGPQETPAATSTPAPAAPAVTIEDVRAQVPKAMAVDRAAVMSLFAKWNVDVAKGQKVGDVVKKPADLAQFIIELKAIG